MVKILCIYALHEYNLNLDFFIKHGMTSTKKQPTNVDFYFVINDPELKLEIPGATVINRENRNFDFGGWSEVLFRDSLYENYDYFIFINSSVRGPFYPVWHTQNNWVDLFINRITPDLKLFGIMIGTANNTHHVQSMFMVTDRIGLQIGIDQGIFGQDQETLTMQQTIFGKEIGFSKAILAAGYNIGCMLKLFDGVDFRTGIELCSIPGHKWEGFFEDGSYSGINVHPYETIFCKLHSRTIRLFGKNLTTADLFTNWTEGRKNPAPPTFDWLQYLVRNQDLVSAGITTKEGALDHYNKHGISEGRILSHVPTRPLTYLIDLNPLYTSGLINQLYSLINGILIGHFTGRNIALEHFHGDYDRANKIPINKVIDVQRLNCLIAELNLNTYLVPVDGSKPGWCYPSSLCLPSQYHNPTKKLLNEHGFVKMLSLLRSETKLILNLGDVFSDSLFRLNSDPEIKGLFVSLLTGLRFTYPFEQIVKQIRIKYGLNDYLGVHLRLENDMLNTMVTLRTKQYSNEAELMRRHGDLIYPHFKKKISEASTGEKKVFLATHLSKSSNVMNWAVDDLRKEYDVIVVSWRQDNPDFYKGREIDAIIDYLLAIQSSSFIGWNISTYSQAIQMHSKNYIDIGVSTKTYHDESTLLYRVVKDQVGHGILGLSGRLGFVEGEASMVHLVEDVSSTRFTISAHAPSEVVIDLRSSLLVQGHCSTTCKESPELTFICDGKKIGSIKETGAKTDCLLIRPGIHKLTVETSVRAWSHSVWILRLPE